MRTGSRRGADLPKLAGALGVGLARWPFADLSREPKYDNTERNFEPSVKGGRQLPFSEFLIIRLERN